MSSWLKVNANLEFIEDQEFGVPAIFKLANTLNDWQDSLMKLDENTQNEKFRQEYDRVLTEHKKQQNKLNNEYESLRKKCILPMGSEGSLNYNQNEDGFFNFFGNLRDRDYAYIPEIIKFFNERKPFSGFVYIYTNVGNDNLDAMNQFWLVEDDKLVLKWSAWAN